jgi:hypothetical protein
MSAALDRDDHEGRLTRPKLDAVLAAVCAQADLDPTGAELIKFTNNAVFRLQRQPVVVRIAGSATMRARVDKVVAVARWLATQRLSAVQLLSEIPQPVRVGEHLATLWRYLPPTGSVPGGRDLGHILRQLHAAPGAPGELPSWRPVDSIRSRLADAERLDPDDVAFLESTCAEVETARRSGRESGTSRLWRPDRCGF